MKLISMKRTPDEQKEDMPTPLAGPGEPYPYGLRLSLCDEELKKLGVTQPQGDYTLVAKVNVVRTSTSTDEKGETDTYADLQITEMVLAPVVADPAEKLWPSK